MKNLSFLLEKGNCTLNQQKYFYDTKILGKLHEQGICFLDSACYIEMLYFID